MARARWQQVGRRSTTRSRHGGPPLRLEALEERNLLSFLPAVNTPAGTAPTSVAVADFNGDGIPDLAVTDYGTEFFNGSVTVLLGNGDGSYRMSAVLPNLAGPRSLAVGDFTGSGKLDIAEVGYFASSTGASSSSISIFLGNGDGTFQARRFVNSSPALSSIVAADLNGDGVTDLVVTNDDSLFGPASGVTVYLGNGDATFRPLVTYYVAPSTHNFATLGEFDGDSFADLAVANAGTNSVAVLLGQGDGSFRLPAYYPAGGTPTVVTPEGGNLVTVNTLQGTVSVLPGNGDGTFGSPQLYNAGSKPTGVAVADFNGDGLPDLAVTNGQGVHVLLGNPDGTFTAFGDFAVGANPSWTTAADLNGDGLTDLAVANMDSDNVSVLLNDGNWSPPPDRSAIGALPSDLDGTDGLPDPAVSRSLTPEPVSLEAPAGSATAVVGGVHFWHILASTESADDLAVAGLDLGPGW